MSCPECFKGAIHDHEGEFKGSEQTIHGMRTYVTQPPSSTNPSTILYLCDAFGLELANNKILCDRYAAATGCRVIAPDCIPGGPAPVHTLKTMDTLFEPVAWYDIVGQMRRALCVVELMRTFIPFLLFRKPSKAYPTVLEYARKIKAELPKEGKLGVAGFCWGGWPSTKLCTETATQGGGGNLIDAQFTAHPSFISKDMVVEAVTKHKVPYALALGSKDHAFKKSVAEETEAEIREKTGSKGTGEGGYVWDFKFYEDCGHGFAVRAAPGNKVETQGSEDAADQAIGWFKKHLS